MKIRLLGQRNALGGGVHFAEFANALKSLRLLGSMVEEVDAANMPALENAARQSTAEDVNIWFWRHPAVSFVKGTRVLWAIFESDRLPDDYVAYLRDNAHVIWVPSEWGKGVLVEAGIDPAIIDVVPEGVNPANYHRHLRPKRDARPKPFRFLSVGKYEERKAYRALLEAFKQAFDNDPDVQLILKADYFLKFEQKKAELEALVRSTGLTNVQMLWGEFNPDMLFALYNHADAFVFPSRAEGWGLPLIEAMATGVPTITTFYSGHTEFLRHVEDSILKVDYDLEVIDDPEFHGYWPKLRDRGARWAAPRVASIALAMRAVVADHPRWTAAAAGASDVLRRDFDWRQAAERGYSTLVGRGLCSLSVNFT